MMIRSLSVFLIVAAVSVVPAPVAAGTIVVPGAMATVEGNSENGFPFDTASMRYQQVYLAGEFGPTAIWIDAIRFRPDSVHGDGFLLL